MGAPLLLPRLVRIIVWLLIIAWAISSLWWPMGRDQGIFAWVGDTILHGGVPYRDAWEQKGPLTHYPYALAQALFGRTMWGIRLLDFIPVAAAAAALFALGRRLHSHLAGEAGAVLFLLWYANVGYWSTCQPDGAAAMLVTVALVLTVHAEGRSRHKLLASAGALVGLATLFKPQFACFLLLPLAYTLATSRGEPARALARPALACVVPFLGVLGLCAAWFAAWGALDDLVEVHITFNRATHMGAHMRTMSDALSEVYRFSQVTYCTAALPLGVLGFEWLRRNHRPLFWTALLWMLLAFACVWIQDKFYDYHWLLVMPPVALTTALGLAWAVRREPLPPDEKPVPHRANWPAAAVLLAVLTLTSFEVGADLADWARGVRAGNATAYLRQFRGGEDYNYEAQRDVAAYLQARSHEGDTVFVWGFDPLINYLSGRRPPTRFGFDYPLTRGATNPFDDAYRREFMADLRAGPPLYIIVADKDANNLMGKTSKEYLGQFPELQGLLDEGYELDMTLEDYELYRRVPVTDSGTAASPPVSGP